MKKQTWLVTGTSTGFGYELAKLLAQKDNVNLAATARKKEDLAYLDQFDKGQIAKVLMDVTVHEQVEHAAAQTLDAFGSIDVLVNNAGIGYFGSFEESDIAAVKKMFDINVWGLVDMTKAVLPQMRKQKSGTIVGLSSVGGLVSFPTLSFYHGTKYAVEGLMESLAQEVADFNIKVMLVEPSGFRTNWAGKSSLKMMPKIEGYEKLGPFIQANESGAGHEAGDPKALAEIVYDQIANNYAKLPLRLPLGVISVEKSLEKFEGLVKSFKEISVLGKSADRPE